MKRIVVLVVVVAGLVVAGTAQAAPSAAAVATRDCLRSHGWSAVIVTPGGTVNGRAPRSLGTVYPYRPWYSVSLSPYFEHGYSELRMKLNAGEAKIATLCRTVGLRHQ